MKKTDAKSPRNKEQKSWSQFARGNSEVKDFQIVNITIEDSLHREAKALSSLQGKSLADFVRRALQAKISVDIGRIGEEFSSLEFPATEKNSRKRRLVNGHKAGASAK